jgi:protein-S-isoprenylcysteine O-methyltransferase Ste14
MIMWSHLARLRVPLGFVCAAVAFWLAHPTPTSFAAGMGIALLGEAVRVWASGHLEKEREVTRSGPYRLVRHPLYAGSAMMGLGFVVAGRNGLSAILVAGYLSTTLVAAMRMEEATLESRYAGDYAAYRVGRATPMDRSFSLARVIRNREYRALAGFVGVGLLLWLRMRFA